MQIAEPISVCGRVKFHSASAVRRARAPAPGRAPGSP
jgi:hypothetical protein